MRYLDLFNLSQNQPLLTAVRGVCLKFAEDIINEDLKTPNHEQRLVWAVRTPLTNAEDMMAPIALNATVQSKWIDRANEDEPDRFDDSDIEFIVSSNINKYAALI